MSRIGIYGWGVVAPRSPDVATFAANLEGSESWLTPFEGFGPSTFLVGQPEFSFDAYRGFIDERFPPNKFPQLRQKMGPSTQYALGAFIQALNCNPGLEQTLQQLGSQAQVFVGTGLGDFPTQFDACLGLYRAQRAWDRFWSGAEHNSDRRRYEEAEPEEREELRTAWAIPAAPPNPLIDPGAWDRAEEAWNRFWMRRSDALPRFLADWDGIEAEGVVGDVEAGKLRTLRRKRTALDRLQSHWGCPTPPWLAVSTNLLWNISNTPASQISMIGKITGAAFAPVAACSTFGVALHLAKQAIACGDAKAVVIGATDPPPHPSSVGAFYAARVLAANRSPSLPLTDLRGTHVAGGACIWIVGDHDYMSARGHKPVGLEIVGVGVSSDADHIITPSAEGPREAVRRALADAAVSAEQIVTWDLHATATPGDYLEVANLEGMLGPSVLLTARKGTFGHGMSACGGWELLAQHLGLLRGRLYPVPLEASQLNPELASLPFRFVMDAGCDTTAGAAGKLSMGIGGINACVVSRPWETAADCSPVLSGDRS